MWRCASVILFSKKIKERVNYTRNQMKRCEGDTGLHHSHTPLYSSSVNTTVTQPNDKIPSCMGLLLAYSQSAGLIS